jgi:hypothetical protein
VAFFRHSPSQKRQIRQLPIHTGRTVFRTVWGGSGGFSGNSEVVGGRLSGNCWPNMAESFQNEFDGLTFALCAHTTLLATFKLGFRKVVFVTHGFSPSKKQTCFNDSRSVLFCAS